MVLTTTSRNALARVAQHGTPHEKAVVQHKVRARYPTINIDAGIAR